MTHLRSRKKNGYSAIFIKRNKMLTSRNKILHKYFAFGFLFQLGLIFSTSTVSDKTEVLFNSKTIAS